MRKIGIEKPVFVPYIKIHLFGGRVNTTDQKTEQFTEDEKMKSVLYPGSFDPFTNGHLDLVVRAGQLFDRVVVAVAVNSGKSPMFTLEERKNLIEQSCRQLAHVEVVTFTGLLVDAIDRFDAQAVLRGLRAFSDFEYELQMALMNRNLKPQCETIFMMPTLKNSFVSSSRVKEIAMLGGRIENYVPAPVAKAIRIKLAAAPNSDR